MNKRWMEAAAIGVMLTCGCGEEARHMPWSEPPMDDAAAGAAGEALAGDGGSGGNATEPTPSDECDPHMPDAMATDSPTLDAGEMVERMDASDAANPNVEDQDAGAELNPDAGGGDTMADAGTTAPSAPRAPGAPGEVVVSEVMLDPTVLTDALGEWIELHNPTSADLQLLDCVISDDRSDDFRLSALTLPAGGYAVLGRTSDAASHVDQAYSGMVLANTSDEIVVTCGGIVIDRLAYGPGFPRPAGKSMQLDRTSLNAVDNDESNHWCASVGPGTPGGENAECSAN